jgi:hypothetical protein
MKRQPVEAQIAVKLRIALVVIFQPDRRMILQVMSDARQVLNDVDAHLRQMIARPDAGQHQHLRRIDRTAREDDFLFGADRMNPAVLRVLDPDRSTVFDDHPVHMRAHLNFHIRALHGGTQIRNGGRLATSVHGIHLKTGKTFLRGAVVIRRFLVPGLFDGAEEAVENRVLNVCGLDFPRPFRAVIGIAAVLKGFRTLEIGQHVVERPAGQAFLAPTVVIGVIAAHIGHHVDRRGSAQHLAARMKQAPVVGMGLRFGFVGPVEFRIVPHLPDAERHMDHEAFIAVAGLERQHPIGSVLAQPVGQHAAGRPRAHHDVIDCLLEFGHPVSLRQTDMFTRNVSSRTVGSQQPGRFDEPMSRMPVYASCRSFFR